MTDEYAGLSTDQLVQLAIERILLVEKLNIGCRSDCICRTRFAFLLTEEQLTTLRRYAEKVAAEGIESNEQTVGEALSDLDPLQAFVLQKIARDRKGAQKEQIVGGLEGAKKALEEYIQFEQRRRAAGATGAIIVEI